MERMDILIIEDEERWQNTYRELLGDKYKIECVSNLADAQNVLRRHFFPVALVDIRLDKDDDTNEEGMEVLALIHALDEGTSAIVLTAWGTVDTAKRALRGYDVFDYLEKQTLDVHAMMDMAEKAMQAAKGKAGRRGPEMSMSQLKGLASQPEKTIQCLDCGFTAELNDLLLSLFTDLYPLLEDRQDAKIVPGTGRIPVAQARYWSKAIAEPILLRLGRRDGIAKEIAGYAEHPEELGRAGYLQVLTTRMMEHAGGIIYVLKDVELEEFEARRGSSRLRLDD